MSRKTSSQARWERLYRDRISSSGLSQLRATGADFIETSRDGVTITDATGRKLLDCVGGSNIFNLGRRPNRVALALEQALDATDQGNFPMISVEKAKLARGLVDFVPGRLDRVLFSVTRGEAFDAACKICRGATARPRLVALGGSWFGETGFALSLSSGPGPARFAPLVPDTRIIPFADSEALAEITEQTAAVFLEAVQVENHCRSIESDFLARLVERVRLVNALLVFDETRTGFGRTGRRFAYTGFDVTPDVVLVGEALGGGMFPIAATLFGPRIGSFLDDHPLIHLSTFGGSDLGCFVASRCLEIYETDKPWSAANRMAPLLEAMFGRIIAARFPSVQSVQGKGLAWSLRLECADSVDPFLKRLASNGVFARRQLVDNASVLFSPPLVFDGKDVRTLEAGLVATLDNLK